MAQSTLCVPVDVVGGASGDAKRKKTATRIREAAQDYEADCEKRFIENWRKGRTPMRPNRERPASERLADVRARVATKANRAARDMELLWS